MLLGTTLGLLAKPGHERLKGAFQKPVSARRGHDTVFGPQRDANGRRHHATKVSEVRQFPAAVLASSLGNSFSCTTSQSEEK